MIPETKKYQRSKEDYLGQGYLIIHDNPDSTHCILYHKSSVDIWIIKIFKDLKGTTKRVIFTIDESWKLLKQLVNDLID